MRKTKKTDPIQSPTPPGVDPRRLAVLSNYEDLREFYQAETVKYSRLFIWLQVVTLVGSALTPILLLADSPNISKIVQALPSAIGGLAAAINGAFRYRQDWAQNYTTLSTIMNERQRFDVRASPDYNGTEENAIDNFQKRLSDAAMAEVHTWSAAFTSAAKEKGGSEEKGSHTRD
jgi:hypothetical protein